MMILVQIRNEFIFFWQKFANTNITGNIINSAISIIFRLHRKSSVAKNNQRFLAQKFVTLSKCVRSMHSMTIVKFN